MYRNTNPEQWVMQMEPMFGMDLDPSVYLLLLTAPAEFLCKRDDGQSFSDQVDMREKELSSFREAFHQSNIINKKILDVSNGDEYMDKDLILHEVNKFLNFEK
jgi:hypothetical protein